MNEQTSNETGVQQLPPTTTNTDISHPIINDKIDPSQINLRFLLINSRKYDLLVLSSDSVEDVRKRAFDTWPKGFLETK